MSTELTPLQAPYPAGPAREEDGESPAPPRMKWYLGALWRARWLIVAATVIGAGAGVFAMRFVTLSYEAQATLWIELPQEEDSPGPIRTEGLLESRAWVELLRSFTVLDHAVRERHLYVEALDSLSASALAGLSVADRYGTGAYRLEVDSAGIGYRLVSGDGAVLERGEVGDSVGTELGFLWAPSARVLPAGRSLEFRLSSIRDRAAQLGRDLQPRQQPESNFLQLVLVGSDPREAAATLDAVTERFVDVAAQLKRAKLDELSSVLSDQLRYAEENLRVAETDLESFRVRTITLPSEEATPVSPGLQRTLDPALSSFFELRVQREALRTDREDIGRILAQIRDSVATVDALTTVGAVQRSNTLMGALRVSTEKRAELRSLLERYTGEHERVARLREEIATLDGTTIPGLVSALQQQLGSEQGMFEGRIASAAEELQQIPPRAIEEARLQRRVAIATNLHETLKQRYEEARLASASSIPDVRILDAATAPTAPISDPRPMVLLMALFGCVGLVVAGVIGKEVLDTRVRYPEHVTLEMGLPILGTIPRVAEGANAPSRMQAIESFREMRLAIASAHGTAGPTMVTITSAESGDGKSFVSANLAAAFAQRGDRTLLIDADVRRGSLHRVLNLRRSPGLTDYLRGDVDLESILQPAPWGNAWFIGSGTRFGNAPELLGSPLLGTLVTALRLRFDAILVDSPPLGAGTDPYLLSTVTRDVVMVLRTGTTDRSFAEAKLEMMHRLPVRVLGAVLNDFAPGRQYRYYSYLPGYASEEETGNDEAQLAVASRGKS
jgi:capsular exopolysaccharide synthesis family protein